MVGTFTIGMTDKSRKEVLGKQGGNRRVTVRFYYPAVETEGAKKCAYLTEGKRKEFGKKPDFSLYDRRIAIYEDVPMRDGSFPLILFSHGYGGYVEQNTDLCQHLAEQGYIVASIGHSYEANETVYEDGTSVRFDKSLYLKMFKPFIPAVIDLYKLRGLDLTPEEATKRFDIHQNKYEAFIIQRVEEWAKDDRFALEHIRRLAEEEGSILQGKIDFSKGIGATGHSYGGALAYYHCIMDEEITCGINIDGGIFGNYGEMVNHKPFMQIANKTNMNVISRTRLFHDKAVHFLLFKDMAHNGFTDWKMVVKNKPADMGTADPELVMNTLNEAHIAFFDRYLKNADIDNMEKLDLDETELEAYEMW